MSALLTALCLGLLSCTVYRSPQRHDFEAEYPQYRIENAVAQAHNLKLQSCSQETVAPYASESRLVYLEPEHIALSEYIVNESYILESNNFKGDFCIYENTSSSN